jgi:hypothetical protein
MAPSNEHTVRRQTERRLGRKISATIWQEASAERYVSGALDPNNESGADDLFDHIRVLLRVEDGALEKRVARQRGGPPARDPDLPLRIEALSRLAAHNAAGDESILRFRRSVLGRDGPMTADEAEAYLDAAEPRRPKGIQSPLGGPTETLQYQNRRISHDLRMWPRSPLDQLRKLAIELCESYPWQPAQAAAFIVEGLIPVATPFFLHMPQTTHGTRPRRARIILEIDMWMPAAEVLRAYRHVQRQVLRGHNRPISRRSIELVNFVLQRPAETWQQVLDEWNKEHLTSPYPDYRRLRTAFVRAQQALLTPTYRYWMGD